MPTSDEHKIAGKFILDIENRFHSLKNRLPMPQTEPFYRTIIVVVFIKITDLDPLAFQDLK